MKKIFYLFLLTLLITSCKSVIKEIVINENFKNNYKFDSEIENMIKDTSETDYQLLATYSAIKGNHKKALEYWDLAIPPKIKNYSKKQIDSINGIYKTVQAKEYIINLSKKNQIVIINESHHIASHRVFTESILKGLYKNGYKNLFIEALNNGEYIDSLLNNRKYPIQESGFYTSNPQFGNLIRSALEIGFKIFPYETTQDEGGEPREINQANNIYSIIKTKPKEKYLIYCGSGHALEGKVDFFGGLALAGRLHKLTGIDPLTIDQAFHSEKSKVEFNNPLQKIINIQEPSILLNNKNLPFSYRNKDKWIDIVVFHPKTNYINNRPNWLLKDNYKFVKIDLNNLEINFPIMVMAYKEKDDLNSAVPIDIVEISSQKNPCYLVLKKGKYQILIINKDNKKLVLNKKI